MGTFRTSYRMLPFLDLSDSSQCCLTHSSMLCFYFFYFYFWRQKFEEAQTLVSTGLTKGAWQKLLTCLRLGVCVLHWLFWALWLQDHRQCMCSCHVTAKHASHCPTSVMLILILCPGSDRLDYQCHISCAPAFNLTLFRVLQDLFP